MCYMSDDPVLEYKIVEVLFENKDSAPHLVEPQLRRLLEVCDEIDGDPEVLGSFPPCEPNFLNLPHFRCDVDCACWLTFRLFCLHELSVLLVLTDFRCPFFVGFKVEPQALVLVVGVDFSLAGFGARLIFTATAQDVLGPDAHQPSCLRTRREVEPFPGVVDGDDRLVGTPRAAFVPV